jgi:hypothetical protein
MTGAVHLFVGPSLSPDVARGIFPEVVCHPPAAQGDVLRALHAQPRAIAIVDGYFDLVPAVWHKEILVALSTGVPVLGAASMGALRAAELHPFGMVGHGRIFEWYRDGVLTDDDEVAVVHAGAEDGFRPLSQALVDLRDLYTRAADAGVVAPDVRDRLIATAQALPYPERDRRIVEDDAAGLAASTRAALDAFVATSGPGLKSREASALVTLLAGTDFGDPRWRPAPVRVEPTVFLHRLHNEVHLERASRTSPLPDPSTRLRGLDTHAVLQKKVLTRLLARQLGALLEVPVDDHDLADALARFRLQFDLVDDAEFESWRRVETVGEAALVEFLRDWVVLDKLQRQRTDDIDRMLADHLRIATARARVEAAGHPDDVAL